MVSLPGLLGTLLVMRNQSRRAVLALSALLPAVAAPLLAAPAKLIVDVDKPGARVSPLLYGIFFEEINRAGDGGIYAEMIQNRSFEDAQIPVAWSLIQSGGSTGAISLDASQPLNSKNPNALKLESKGIGGRVGIASDGFKGVPQNPRGKPEVWLPAFEKAPGGIAVQRGQRYNLSLYARAESDSGPLMVSLESRDGKVLASQRISGVRTSWRQFKASLVANASDEQARLVISTQTPGTLWLDMVSMFPQTWKGRSNGLRPDLMQAIAGIKPAFVRFPGGCFVEGHSMADASRWKESIGDIAARPGHWNLWGYRSTDGLGFLEYLQMCEDLGSEPLFVINCGMAHVDHVPMDQMGPYVQDALDAIEYANGPVTSTWGALRAKHGRSRPFNLKMMQIGNENGGPLYNERYALFHDAIKAKYPAMQLVACDWAGGVPDSRPLDIIDPHLYANPRTFLSQANRFDLADRKGPQIYFGEYAVTQEAGVGNAQAALAEAAFMMGMERNGDIVKMSSYAPLLSDLRWKTWNPNAIVFDQSRVYGTPSYHVQAMFGHNRADRVFPTQVELDASLPTPAPRGLIGLGTWGTQAEFKDISVTKAGQPLFNSDFAKGTERWQLSNGDWKVEDGVLRQSGNQEGTRAFVGEPTWSDYTLSLKARKLGGREGFLISFLSPGGDAKSWWNLGGWNNTSHGLEVPGVDAPRVPGQIETGRWYDIRIELQGPSIKCYLDGQLIQQATRTPERTLHAMAGLDERTGETILKVVNAGDIDVEASVQLRGAGRLSRQGKALVLRAQDALSENTFAAPQSIAPRLEAMAVPSGTFSRTFPAHSLSILRVKTAR